MTDLECVRCGRPAPLDPIGRISCDCAIRDQQEVKRLQRRARARMRSVERKAS